MRWINSTDSVVDTQTGELICMFPENADEFNKKIIESAPEIFQAMIMFVNGVDEGEFRARKTYNRLKEIFSRIPENILQDERVQVQ